MKNIKETFRSRLKELRTDRALTQEGAAQAIGLKRQQNWGRWESGEVLPSAETLHQICESLDESADWLLGLTDKRKDGVDNGAAQTNFDVSLFAELRQFRKEIEAGVDKANDFIGCLDKISRRLGVVLRKEGR